MVWLLWNWMLPDLFGWPRIGFWQALGLLVLCRILFGGRTAGGSRIRRRVKRRIRQRMWERWERMSPEERKRVRERMRERWGARLRPPRATGAGSRSAADRPQPFPRPAG